MKYFKQLKNVNLKRYMSNELLKKFSEFFVL